MKTVFKSHELAHIWAAQSQSEGRCAANMHFHKRDFYSYSTVIARVLDDGSVAVATDKYSASTSRHQGYVRQAVNHKKVHRIPRIEAPYDLIRSCKLDCQSYYEKASVARSKRGAYLADAYSISAALNDYLDAINDAGERMPIDQAIDLDAIKAAVKARAAENLAIEKERERVAALRAKELIDSWLNGGAYDYRIRDAGVLLRVMGDKVETSQGAIVPLADALRIYGVIKAASTDSQLRRLHGAKVGVYSVNSCTSKNLVIGCHAIPMSEISRIARLLGVSS